MPALETCKIVDPKTGDSYLIINADDFRPGEHTRWIEPVDSAPQAEPHEASPSAADLSPAPPVAATPRLQLASRPKKPKAPVKRSVK
jgi:hypothetical protein